MTMLLQRLRLVLLCVTAIGLRRRRHVETLGWGAGLSAGTHCLQQGVQLQATVVYLVTAPSYKSVGRMFDSLRGH